MELLKAASDVLQRHFSTVAIYLGIYGLLSLATTGVYAFLRMRYPDIDSAPPLTINVLNIAWFMFYSAVIAFAQCIVFSRIGREVDRPLWKVRDDRDALRRFFVMWFEFNLLLNTTFWIANTPFGEGDLEIINIIVLFVTWSIAVLLVPFGACQMFLGKFSWSTFGEALGPVSRHTGQFLPVFGVTIVQFVFGFYVVTLAQPLGTDASGLALRGGLLLAADVAIAYLDCLVFAASWLICKDDRDSPSEVDLDF